MLNPDPESQRHGHQAYKYESKNRIACALLFSGTPYHAIPVIAAVRIWEVWRIYRIWIVITIGSVAIAGRASCRSRCSSVVRQYVI